MCRATCRNDVAPARHVQHRHARCEVIVTYVVVDEHLHVQDVKNLRLAVLFICSDNVGCNTYSTAPLIGENGAIVVREDLGYSGMALDMLLLDRYAPSEIARLSRLRIFEEAHNDS